MANISVNDWEFKTGHVQPDQIGRDAEGGQNFISAESIVICAVKPASGATNTEDMFPIGVMQNASFQQQKNINQLYEIGSREPFFIPGRTMIQINLTRVVFNGDSLMAVLYDADQTSTGDESFVSPGPIVTDGRSASRKFYINLASELFNTGRDIALIMEDSEGQNAGGIIFRDCVIQSHGMGLSSNQVVVAENVVLRAKSIESLSVTARQ